MIVIGLTGGIAMGKSTVSRQFALLGAVVNDADKAVHRLLSKKGKAVARVAALFPETLEDGAINRSALGKIVFHDAAALRKLEAVLHPLVRQEEVLFLKKIRRQRRKLAVLEIPLLFETHAERRCDLVAVVSAPRYLQKRRAMQRPGMTEEKLRQILSRQYPEYKKRRRADVIIPTGLGKAESFFAVKRLVKRLILSKNAEKKGMMHA